MTRDRDDTWRGVGTGVAIGGAGLLLWLLLKNLGLGGKDGGGDGGQGKSAGEGDLGRGEGQAEQAPPAVLPPASSYNLPDITRDIREALPPARVLPSEPSAPSAPKRPKKPSRSKDAQRLTFVMTQPLATEPFNPMTFLLHADGKTYSLGGMIARIKAGGRSDVSLKIRGDVRNASADEALAFVKKSGIEVWDEGSRVPAVSGKARGHYGGRGYYRGHSR